MGGQFLLPSIIIPYDCRFVCSVCSEFYGISSYDTICHYNYITLWLFNLFNLLEVFLLNITGYSFAFLGVRSFYGGMVRSMIVIYKNSL